MNPDESIETDAAVLAELADRAQQGVVVEPGDVAAYVLRDPSGSHRVETLDAEKLLARPRRRRGCVTALDADSFSRLVTDLGAGDGRSVVYADLTALTITSVLNDHDDNAGWRDHRVSLSIVRTAQWQRWLGLNDKLVDQTLFAQHLEDNLADIVDPPGADMLELAQSFEATIDATFKSAARLRDGARQFTFNENIEARAGKDGTITVPEGFTLAMPPVEGADPVTIRARLRFRIESGKLRIGYQLHRPDEIERAAFDDVVDKVSTATGVALYRAKAPQ